MIYLDNIKAGNESGIFATSDVVNDVKVGEDMRTPTVIEDTPTTIDQILAEPLNLQGPPLNSMDIKQKLQYIRLSVSIRLLEMHIE